MTDELRWDYGTLRFVEQDPVGQAAEDGEEGPWLVAVIDDEPAAFEAIRLALGAMRFDGRPIRLLHAAAGDPGRRLLAAAPDIACVLLEVCVGAETTGLELIREIREELGNEAIRIVLRSAAPGAPPPLELMQRYDINDYTEKTELSRTLLWTSVVCALRSYRQIRMLERSRRGLGLVIDASAGLMRRRGLADYYRGVVTGLAGNVRELSDALLCIRPMRRGAISMVAATERFSGQSDQPLYRLDDPLVRRLIERALAHGEDATASHDAAIYLDGQEWEGVVYVASRTRIDALQLDLLRLYCQNAALGIENARLLDQLSQLAYTDRATGLASRPRLEQSIGRMIEDGRMPSALVVTIAGFSDYTTGLGDAFGHALLRAFAARLMAVHPYPDRVGCLYRNVFCLILDDCDAERLCDLLDDTVRVDERDMRLALSFGLSAPFVPGTASAEIIRQGEIALKSARHLNRKGVAAFSTELEESHRSRALLSHGLRDAMENGEATLAYQALVDVETEAVVGTEALMRWQHPQRGSISPAEFIAAAETSGLIGEVGRWVTRRACREMKPLIAAGALRRVMINLSPVQLRDPDCLAELTAIVEAEGIPYSAVEWEITESATLGGATVLAQLQAARDRGFSIALDDFGTGYSSLSMIRTLPLNVVKIDRSFLLEVATSQNAWSILFSIASICEDLGLAMVAEGVETKAQLKIVRDAKIGTMQGYLISRPLPAGGFAEWLAGRQI
jgi:diguanylate cyclase